MNNQIVVRTVIGLFLIAALYAGYQWFSNWTKDPDSGSTQTADMVVALEYVDGGSRVVTFDAQGKKTVAPDAEAGVSQLDPVWRPDGQRVFFSGLDPKVAGQTYGIFRWNIAKNSIESRYESSRSVSSPTFGPAGWPDLGDSALVLIGGSVFEFDQRDKQTKQILPPTEFESAETDEAGQAQSIYKRIGTSFKSAKWGKDRKVIFAVMRREDDEVFIVDYREKIGDVNPGPQQLFAAQQIEFDVAPDGTAVVAIMGFEYVDPSVVPPGYMKNGRALKPFRNALFMVPPAPDGGIAPPVGLFSDQPDLGIVPGQLTDAVRMQDGIPADVKGLYVEEVTPKSAAEYLKMQRGDVLVSVEGKPTDTPQAYFEALQKVLIGQTAAVTFYSKAEKAVKTLEYQFGVETSMALHDPAVSPDSKYVAVTSGRVVDRYTFEPQELLILPLDQSGIAGRRRLVQGRIYEPSWHPSGNSLVYSKIGPTGDSQIYVINADGSGERNLSGPGDYGLPKFSPSLRSGS